MCCSNTAVFEVQIIQELPTGSWLLLSGHPSPAHVYCGKMLPLSASASVLSPEHPPAWLSPPRIHVCGPLYLGKGFPSTHPFSGTIQAWGLAQEAVSPRVEVYTLPKAPSSVCGGSMMKTYVFFLSNDRCLTGFLSFFLF